MIPVSILLSIFLSMAGSVASDRVPTAAAREGARCTGLIANARAGKTLTTDEANYLEAWCQTKDPNIIRAMPMPPRSPSS